jgi:hypothetical protein
VGPGSRCLGPGLGLLLRLIRLRRAENQNARHGRAF